MSLWSLAFALLAVWGCGAPQRHSASVSPVARSPVLDAARIAGLIPGPTIDREGWAAAVFNGLAANHLSLDVPSACAVIAVIAQESGFQADPEVPGLAAVVALRIHRYEARLGPLGAPLVRSLLSGRSPDDARPFAERLKIVRTERDVDVLFRDLLAYHRVNHPAVFAAASWAGQVADVQSLAELNPVTTAGSMQVSVRFATEWARAHSADSATPERVRDALYTRLGGVYFGAARLLGYPVRYDDSVFRFADYNAGFYASRNAAWQSAVARLTGRKLSLDGDLLAYRKDGSPRDDASESQQAVEEVARRFALDLSREEIRRDLLTEKTLGFEETATYRAVRRVARDRLGASLPDAVLPQVTLSSPKMTRTRSTAWFAQSVERRYRACLSSGGGETGTAAGTATR